MIHGVLGSSLAAPVAAAHAGPGLGFEGTIMLAAFIWLVLVVTFGLASAQRRSDFCEVSPEGLRPSQSHDVLIPAGHFAGLEPRLWRRIGSPGGRPNEISAHLSVHLVDGRTAVLVPLQRTMRRNSRQRRIFVSTAADPRWRTLLDDHGKPVRWTQRTDAAVTELLERRIAPCSRRLQHRTRTGFPCTTSSPTARPLLGTNLRSVTRWAAAQIAGSVNRSPHRTRRDP